MGSLTKERFAPITGDSQLPFFCLHSMQAQLKPPQQLQAVQFQQEQVGSDVLIFTLAEEPAASQPNVHLQWRWAASLSMEMPQRQGQEQLAQQ